jgi:hypothetical protein
MQRKNNGRLQCWEFNQLVTDKHLSVQQVNNADETSLFWKYLPWKTVVTPQKSAPHEFKDSKQRLTVLVGSHAAGTQKARLFDTGKSRNAHVMRSVNFASHICSQ